MWETEKEFLEEHGAIQVSVPADLAGWQFSLHFRSKRLSD